ncbi:MAG: YCF48-related protein [Bacteroidales bacterium]
MNLRIIILLFLTLVALYLAGQGTFILRNSGTNEDLSTVHFADKLHGWAAGMNGTLVKTVNGGRSWSSVELETVQHLNGIYFIDVDTGFIVGENSTIITTRNGGIDWEYHELPATGDLTAIQFVDASTGFIIGHGVHGAIFMKSTDGGRSWETKQIRENDLNGSNHVGNNDDDIYFMNFSFLDENTGVIGGFKYSYVYGRLPFVCKTTDGGQTFVNISPDINQNDWYIGKEIAGINFINSNDAIAVVNSAVGSDFLLISDYRIKSFNKSDQQSNFTTRGRFYSSEFLGRFIGYFTGIVNGETQIIKTIDQGNSFMFLSPPTRNTLYASCFINTNTGFFVGQKGTIIQLHDDNNIIYSEESENERVVAEPPYTLASINKKKKKTQIHVYNVDFNNRKKYDVELINSRGKTVSLKRIRVKVFSDEVRMRIKTPLLKTDTYFYSVKYANSPIVNGKVSLESYVFSGL